MKRAALVGVLLVAVAMPASASAWTAHLSVGAQAAEWQSPQTFKDDGFLRLRVFARGHELMGDDLSDCASELYGYGLAVHVNACGDHLVIRAANSRAKQVRLRIHYYRV